MLKLFNRKKKDNKGFTLVELVIVVAILAILVGILAPQYTKYVEKSRKAADASNLENLVTAFKTAASDGADTITAGTYGIQIKTKQSTGNSAVAGTYTAAAADGGVASVTQVTALEDLLGSYAGSDWVNTSLKSNKWTTTQNDNTGTTYLNAITAKIEVKNDGSVNVSYEPTWIKDMAK